MGLPIALLVAEMVKRGKIVALKCPAGLQGWLLYKVAVKTNITHLVSQTSRPATAGSCFHSYVSSYQ